MDNRRIIFIAIAVIAVIFIFNPFGARNQRKIPQPRIDPQQLEELKSHIQAYRRTPEQLVLEAFDQHDIVFLGGISDSSVIKEHTDLYLELIPQLHENGVYNIGIEQALYNDQARIDELVTSERYDEGAARQVLFNRHVMWGYEEYAEIFKRVWELNNYLTSDQKPMRIVGISPRNEWKYLQKQKDLENNETKKKILAQGLTSVFMAQAIKNEIIEKGEKALIISRAPEIFTRYRYKKYAEDTLKTGFTESRNAGNIIFDEIGDRAATILLHYPWPDDRSVYRFGRPFDGAFDALLADQPGEQLRVGVFARGTPFGDLRIKNGGYAYGYEDLTMKDLCEGYVIFRPLHEHTTITPIPDFITRENFPEALENFPAPKSMLPFKAEKLDKEKDVEQAIAHMNQLIAGYSQNTLRFLAYFKFP
jgi:hypothetical protein